MELELKGGREGGRERGREGEREQGRGLVDEIFHVLFLFCL